MQFKKAVMMSGHTPNPPQKSRAALRCNILISRRGSGIPLQATTENIGRDGFLIVSPFEFAPEEILWFRLELAAGAAGCSKLAIVGHALVERCEKVATVFAVECSFKEYFISE